MRLFCKHEWDIIKISLMHMKHLVSGQTFDPFTKVWYVCHKCTKIEMKNWPGHHSEIEIKLLGLRPKKGVLL